jgi:hypothetical protein
VARGRDARGKQQDAEAPVAILRPRQVQHDGSDRLKDADGAADGDACPPAAAAATQSSGAAARVAASHFAEDNAIVSAVLEQHFQKDHRVSWRMCEDALPQALVRTHARHLHFFVWRSQRDVGSGTSHVR